MYHVDSGSKSEMQTGYPETTKFEVILGFLQLIKDGLDKLNEDFCSEVFMALGLSPEDLN